MLWSNKILNKGFTLIEMMVVISIVSIIMTILLLSRNKLSDRLNLKNQAYELSAMIRQAQSYSLGVKSNGGNFDVSYGVWFSLDNPNTAVFFADNNKNGQLDGGEALQTYTLNSGVLLNILCGTTGGSENCISVQKMGITFLRPNPSASILFLNSSGNPVSGRNPPGRITIQSPNGGLKSIKVDSSGQVSIQ